MKDTGERKLIEEPLIQLGLDPWSETAITRLQTCPLGVTAKQLIGRPGMRANLTAFWEWGKKEFEAGRKINGKWDGDQWLRDRINSLRPLIQSIGEKGYLYDNYKSYQVWEFDGTPYPVGPMTLGINADGSFNFNMIDGYRRLCILAAMGLPIKIMVAYRDPQWTALQDALIKHRDGKKYVYSPMPHPDFSTWEIGYNRLDKYLAIRKFVQEKGPGDVLDVGTHFSYSLYALARSGLMRYGAGIENYEIWANVARVVCNAIGADLFHKDIISALQIKSLDRTFDYGIATAIAYHLLRVKGVDLTRKVFGEIGRRSNRLIFDDIKPGREDIGNCPKEVAEDLVKYTMIWSGHKNPVKIGEDSIAERSIWVTERA